MVDLYRRAGLLDLAAALINGMPFPAGAIIWHILLAASRVHSNVELGKLAAENLISLQPHDSTTYVLVTGNWKERAKVRRLMDVEQLKKKLDVAGLRFKN